MSGKAAEALYYGICSLSAISVSYSQAIIVDLYKMISWAGYKYDYDTYVKP